jgi:hypothetical protein
MQKDQKTRNESLRNSEKTHLQLAVLTFLILTLVVVLEGRWIQPVLSRSISCNSSSATNCKVRVVVTVVASPPSSSLRLSPPLPVRIAEDDARAEITKHAQAAKKSRLVKLAYGKTQPGVGSGGLETLGNTTFEEEAEKARAERDKHKKGGTGFGRKL